MIGDAFWLVNNTANQRMPRYTDGDVKREGVLILIVNNNKRRLRGGTVQQYDSVDGCFLVHEMPLMPQSGWSIIQPIG